VSHLELELHLVDVEVVERLGLAAQAELEGVSTPSTSRKRWGRSDWVEGTAAILGRTSFYCSLKHT
jgi:hypothetical protein